MTPIQASAVPDALAGAHRVTAMIVALYPSAQLVGHCDPPITGTRIHVPVQMNDGCWVFHGGVWQQLELGQSYVMDPAVVHGAVNWGADLRLHLMVDVHGEV